MLVQTHNTKAPSQGWFTPTYGVQKSVLHPSESIGISPNICSKAFRSSQGYIDDLSYGKSGLALTPVFLQFRCCTGLR